MPLPRPTPRPWSPLATPTGDVDKTIGILAAGETDEPANRLTINRLAFQDYDQTCAYYPDSDFTSHDKQNVRDGHYQIWGPLHLLTKVNSGTKTPSDADVKTVIDILTGKVTVADVKVLDLAISKHMVPECAMRVQRTTELGPLSSFQPEESCGCYFDATVIDGEAPAECAECDTDADCVNPDRPSCNFGYCEVQ